MPFGIVLLLVNVGLIVHAAKTGRFWPWGYIILFIPGFGALAYVLVELAPEWFGSVQGQKARRRVVNPLDPSKRYRALTEQLKVADTIANRAALAEECLELGKFTEAEYHYEHILALPIGDDPIYAFGRGRAQFGRGQPAEAVATLDDLRKRWPDYQSAESHLLYARALEESGRSDHALDEYRALANYYPGAEARVRYGLLLQKSGRPVRCSPSFSPSSSGRRTTSAARRPNGSRSPRRRCAVENLSWNMRRACVTTGGH
jgi:hypothetical protein